MAFDGKFLLRLWKTNDRDASNMSVEQLSVALRMISARLAQAMTNRETRVLKEKIEFGTEK